MPDRSIAVPADREASEAPQRGAAEELRESVLKLSRRGGMPIAARRLALVGGRARSRRWGHRSRTDISFGDACHPMIDDRRRHDARARVGGRLSITRRNSSMRRWCRRARACRAISELGAGPHIVGLTILCRGLTNFRTALLLAELIEAERPLYTTGRERLEEVL